MIQLPLMFLNNWRLIATLAIILASFTSGYYIRSLIADREELAILKEAQDIAAELQNRLNITATQYELTIADLRQKNRTTEGKLRHEVQSNSVYSSCVASPVGVQQLQDAAKAANAARKLNRGE